MVAFCGQTERLGNGQMPRWGISHLTYAFARKIPAIADKQEALTDATLAGISACCGLTFEQIEDDSRANIVFSTLRGPRAGMDGPGKTLAFAYLPEGPNFKGQLGCYFDLDENWIEELIAAVNQGKLPILYVPTLNHEVGHNLGLDHSDDERDAMFGSYNPNMFGMQPGDVKRLQDRYGPSKKSGGTDPVKDWKEAIKTIELRLFANGIDLGAIGTINR